MAFQRDSLQGPASNRGPMRCNRPTEARSCASRVKIAPVGYQPVGTKPLTMLRPPLLTSTTATALLSAVETISVLPSGESDREFGVAVPGAFGVRLIEICSIAMPEKVS